MARSYMERACSQRGDRLGLPLTTLFGTASLTLDWKGKTIGHARGQSTPKLSVETRLGLTLIMINVSHPQTRARNGKRNREGHAGGSHLPSELPNAADRPLYAISLKASAHSKGACIQLFKMTKVTEDWCRYPWDPRQLPLTQKRLSSPPGTAVPSPCIQTLVPHPRTDHHIIADFIIAQCCD